VPFRQDIAAMPIRSKFYIAFATILAILVITGIIIGIFSTRFSDIAAESREHIEIVNVLYRMKTVADRASQEALSGAFATHLDAAHGLGSETGFAEAEVAELAEAAEELEVLFTTYSELEALVGDAEEEVAAVRLAIDGLRTSGGELIVALTTDDISAIEAALLTAEDATEAFTIAIDNALVPDIEEQNALSDTIVENARNGVILSTIAFAIVVVSIGGGGLWLIRSIVQPVRHLQTAAQEMTKGNYSYRAANLGQDEIGQAAQAFNTMAAAVQERDKSLTELNANLEQRVDERTRQLQKAIAVAEENARIKSQFLANMSHELRTPLNAILGFTGIMMEGMGGEIDNDARYMIKRIQSNSTRLLELIDSVLDLAKIEAGRIDIINAPFSPRDLAERWKAEVGVLAQQKNLAFEVKVDPELPNMLIGDEARLSQIALNLLSNAVKFTATGSVKLQIGVKDDNWTLQVSDTGIGIPPHALNYIFEEFRQVDGTTTRMYGGSGLGLAIVRNLCLMMNGTVRVSSQVGKGSTFTVTLPLTPVEEALVQA
jgi:signal transduction histidine kinase